MTRAVSPRAAILLPLLLVATSALAEPVTASSRDLDAGLRRYLDHGGVVVTHRGAALFGHRQQERFIPASTLKIATALAVIRHLGLDYRYRTEIYLSPGRDLTIRGFGDPFLVSEEWALIARELAASDRLPAEIRNLFLDTSSFAGDLTIPGIEATLNPYDVANGALAANFNTLHVVVTPDGGVRSAEPQTPLTPLARKLAAKLPPGQHRINISRDAGAPARYAGELLRELLAEQGHPVLGRIAERPIMAGDQRILSHRSSRDLEQVIAAMMEYSNNFIANQLLLTVGLEVDGEPATLAKGVRLLSDYLQHEVGLEPADFHVVEGSGISRQNLFTPVALAEVVRAFYPYRRLLSRHQGVLAKTGTLSGVFCLAGFLPSEHPMPFVIMLSQRRNTRDQILALLEREVARTFEPLIRSAPAAGAPDR